MIFERIVCGVDGSPAGFEALRQATAWRQAGADENLFVSVNVSSRQLDSPDLVEAVLAGRQSSQLTARHVMKQFPWDWGEQRRRFAVASESRLSFR